MSLKSLMLGLVIGAAAVGAAWAQSTPAKKAYVLVQVDVTNPDQYAGYAKTTPATVEKHGGKFIARAGRSLTLEGAKAPARIVVIEFPSYDAAQAWYNSAEYTASRKLRAGAATVHAVLVEGM